MLTTASGSCMYAPFFNQDPTNNGWNTRSDRLRAEVAEAQRAVAQRIPLNYGAGPWMEQPNSPHPLGNSGVLPQGDYYRYEPVPHVSVAGNAAQMTDRFPIEALGMAAGDRQRAAEIVALQNKLDDARRRQTEELARAAGIADRWNAANVGPRSPQRPGSSVASAAGPMLVCRRRIFGGHAFRLWVEDRGALGGGARVHAADEETGGRTHTDVSDSMLSMMLATFRESDPAYDGCEQETDVDEFLEALLDEAYFSVPVRGNALELRLPAKVSKTIPHLPAQLVERQSSVLSEGSSGVPDAPPTQHGAAAMPWYCAGVVWPDGQEAPMPKRMGATATAAMQSQQRPQSPRPPVAPNLATDARPLGRGTPCLQRGGPDGGGGHASMQHSRTHAPMGGGGFGSSSGSRASSPQSGLRPEDTRRPRGSGSTYEVRPPPGPPSSSFGSTSKPPHRRALVRPRSAPQGAGAPRGTGPRARPQSARHPGNRDEAALMNSEAHHNWAVAAERPRRVRPTSAKALKHRRVMDDGVDSIIYEDIEEEEEEYEVHIVQLVDESTPAETSVADGTAAAERRAIARGSTGGCSSCSSLRGGSGSASVSSRSVSRSRRPSSAREGGGGRVSSRTPSAAAESRSQEPRWPPHRTTGRMDRPGSARGPRPPVAGAAAAAALSRAIAAARGEAEDEDIDQSFELAAPHLDAWAKEPCAEAADDMQASAAPHLIVPRPPAERRIGAARPGGHRVLAHGLEPSAAASFDDAAGTGDVADQTCEADSDGTFDVVFQKYGAEMHQVLGGALAPQYQSVSSAASRVSAGAARAAAASAAAVAAPRMEIAGPSEQAASLGRGPRASSPPPRRAGTICCSGAIDGDGFA